jgi:lysylphosphatidylglycerol synthetase-like protein (DUF2156 family)
MPCNIGIADRVVRVVIGLALTVLPLLTGFAAGSSWLWWAALVVGLVMLATAGMRFCPLYSLLGIRTCRP